MHPQTPPCQPRRGMTLVEALVVLTVIAILAALLLPALQKAWDSAYNVSCSNNLKTIGKGCVLYVEELGLLPHNDRTWPRKEYSWACIMAINEGGDEVGPVNFGRMIETGHLELEAMWCPRSDRVRTATLNGDQVAIGPNEPTGLPAFPTPPLGGHCYSSYIKAGTQLSVDGPHTHPEVISPASISRDWYENTDRAVFTEFIYHHTTGVNALYGDGSVQFIHTPPEKWDINEPIIFKHLMEQKH